MNEFTYMAINVPRSLIYIMCVLQQFIAFCFNIKMLWKLLNQKLYVSYQYCFFLLLLYFGLLSKELFNR